MVKDDQIVFAPGSPQPASKPLYVADYRLCWPRINDAGTGREVDAGIHCVDAGDDFCGPGSEALKHILPVEHRCIAVDILAGNTGLGEPFFEMFGVFPVDGEQYRRAIFAAHPPSLYDVGEPTHPAYLQSRDITHTYWFERRVYERKSTAEFNAELAKIQKAIANLQTTLSHAPQFVRSRVDLQLWVRSGRPGARPKSYIATAAAALVELWRRAGKVFELRFDSAEGTGSPRALEFVGTGPQFVWRLMSVSTLI